MTQVHLYVCEGCDLKVHATYNGEHWLPPEDWLKLCDQEGVVLGDICPECDPRKFAPKERTP